MIVYRKTEGEARLLADACHEHLIATDVLYAESVAGNHTIRWWVPQLDVDADGNPTGRGWTVLVDARMADLVTQAERDVLCPPSSF